MDAPSSGAAPAAAEVDDPIALEAQVQLALGRGDLLVAFDLATSAMARGVDTPEIAQKRLLAMARMGDTHLALAEAERIGLADRNDEDSVALRARLLKDLALRAPSGERERLLLTARDAYEQAHALDRGYYSAINAATLSRLGGDLPRALTLASLVLADARVAEPKDYYGAATAMEALLLLGRGADARRALERALALNADVGMHASTLRQMVMLSAEIDDLPAVEAIIERLRPAPVVHFAGHMFRADERVEAGLRARIEAQLDLIGATSGFGALACGADIVFAEALLDRGIELNVVLPFAIDDFLHQSVEPFGAEVWRPRFDAALAGAASVQYASDSAYAGDPGQFAYGNEYAMGLACLRAQHLCTRAVHMAIWDGRRARGTGGTAETIERWRGTGREAIVIDSGPIDRARPRAPVRTMPPGFYRENRAIIFTDYSGFSKLDERTLPIFWSEVMGRVGTVLEEAGEATLFRNTWGDALYAVIADPGSAAEVATRLRDALAEIDAEAVGLPVDGGMRVALHFGPVYRARDPVTGGTSYFGTEVTRTARMEPVTPIGEIYMTQSYAAFLALTGDERFTASYVGTIALAKEFGSTRMHKLVRATPVQDEAASRGAGSQAARDAESARLPGLRRA